MTSDPFDLCGRVLNGMYRVDSFVASGGFGVVYRAMHLGWSEPVAIKCLRVPSGLTAATEGHVLRRFQVEVRVHYRLEHLGIVRALGMGTTRSPRGGGLVPFAVMEWLDGRTLADDIRERGDVGPLPLESVVSLLDSPVQGLAYAHSVGLVHRDVKPRNVFRLAQPRGSCRAKLIDFGAAKVLENSPLGPVQPTAPGFHTLSLPYAAPEQFEPGVGAVGPWSDVYSLALTVLEAVTGRRVMRAGAPPEFAARALDRSHRPHPRTLGLRWQPQVADVFRVALSVDPADRWPDAGVFWGSLKQAMAQARPSAGAGPTTPRALPNAIGLDDETRGYAFWATH